MQIADGICDGVLSGAVPPGERIPSVRDYSAQMGVNVNTVVRSYEYLNQKGIIYNKRGIGYFISPDASERVYAVNVVKHSSALKPTPIFSVCPT